MTATTRRIASLDYLRGLLAIAVMVYHYTSWSTGPIDAANVLGRLGIYAVSTFYVLSGLSLGIVYGDRIEGAIGRYAVKRVFRIAPLFWVVVTWALLFDYLDGGMDTTPLRIFLNYTLLFGFVMPDAYLSTGAWSIGNEIVFYALLPLVLIVSNRVRGAFPIMFSISIAMGALFAFWQLTPSDSIEAQWSTYIHPANQFFLFMAGVGISRLQWRSRHPWLLALAALAVFCLYPASGGSEQLIVGWTRVFMSAACIAFVMAIYHAAPEFKSARALTFIGEGCYSIYLLHPLVASTLIQVIPGAAGYMVAFVGTLVASHLSFRYVEKPMMRFASSITARPALTAERR